MSPLDESIERLINRKLDGELTEEEGLELDRALIRSPEHRRMFEASETIDAVCAELIRAEVEVAPGAAVGMPAPVVWVSAPIRSGRAWWLLPSAMAAGLAWLVFVGLPGSRELRFDPTTQVVERGPSTVQPSGGVQGVRSDSFRQVGTHAGFTDGRRDTGVYRVIGNDGRLYLIQLDHMRAVRRPASRSRTRVEVDDL